MSKILSSVPFAVVFGIALIIAGAAIATNIAGQPLSAAVLAISACGAGTYIGMTIRRRRLRRRH